MDTITQTILDNFANKGKRYESPDVMGKKIWGAVAKGHQLGKGFHDIASAEADLKGRAKALDSDDPNLSTVEKVIKRLADGRYAEAVKLVEELINARKELEKQAIYSNASNIANQRHKSNNEVIAEALEYYKRKKQYYNDKNEAAEDLAEKFPPIKQSTYRRYLKGL